MIQKRIVDPWSIFGMGYLNAGVSGLKKGAWVKLDGTWAAAGGPSGLEGDPGYATIGAIKFSPASTGDGATIPAYPIDKEEFQKESSNLTLDTLVSGEGIVTYRTGIFETDQYATDITSAMAVGTPLYLNTSSILASAVSGPQRATFLGIKSGFDADHVAKALIMFEIKRGSN